MIVRGAVQGVFFRDSCRQAALAANVNGWVRNSPDGSVEAVFEGDPESVRALCEWCREGPPHARVADVEVVAEPVRGESGFQVR
ncbi:MAG: acylphosphatase [Nocardioidaceae bacterium]|nr:acylphosphatase [Nocardioidaceae bacterium]